MFLNAATIGLVMSLANPHSGNRMVTSTKGTNIALETTGAEDLTVDMGLQG
jgi:hypothetical protein